MGKLKTLMLDVQTVIDDCVQDGWDECLSTIEESKNVTRENIDHKLGILADEQGFQLEDLELLFTDETIEELIDDALYSVWEV